MLWAMSAAVKWASYIDGMLPVQAFLSVSTSDELIWSQFDLETHSFFVFIIAGISTPATLKSLAEDIAGQSCLGNSK
jgi:hypothetical protein